MKEDVGHLIERRAVARALAQEELFFLRDFISDSDIPDQTKASIYERLDKAINMLSDKWGSA